MQFSTSTSHSMLSQLHSSNLHTLTVCKRLMPAVTNAWSRPHIQSDGVCGVPRFFTTLETDDSVEEKMRLKRQEMAESLRRYTENTGIDPEVDDEEDDLEKGTFTNDNTDELAELCMRRYRFYDPEGMTERRLKVLVSKLPQYRPKESDAVLTTSQLTNIRQKWVALRREEIDKVTYENLSNYQP